MQNAKWIWYGANGYDLVNSWMQARRCFYLKVVPAKAIIQVTADSRYRLYLNGKHVNRGPARGFQSDWPYDTLDIASFLKKGKNVISAMVHNYGIGTFQYIHQGFAGFLLSGKVGREDISTGPEWRVRPAPGNLRVTTRVSLQLGFQEFFDARLENDDWLSADYDDNDWIKPICRNIGSMPWNSLEERGIPLLHEKVILPKTIISQSIGKRIRGDLENRDAVSLLLTENHQWKKSSVVLSKSKEWVSISVSPAGQGNYSAYCIDFGKEVVGSIGIAVDNAEGGEVIDSIVCEEVDGNIPIIKNPREEWCKMAFGNRLILRQGKTQHEQFEHWGFRYLILCIRNCRKKIDFRFRLNWAGYPLDIQAGFLSSNEKLNQIYQASAWTQQCCMLDAYLDCPWREQAQWWGDARVQGANTFYLSADARLFRRGIRQIGKQQLENGLTYGHAPTVAHECILPDFTLVWLLTHWDYYWQTDDLDLFIEMKERIHRALDYFDKMASPTGLLPYDDRYWLFLDWTPIFKEGYPTLYNLLYLMALKHISRLFRLTGDRKSNLVYSRRAKELEANIKKRLFNKKDGAIYGGLSRAMKPIQQDSPHIYTFAILLDLFPEYQQEFMEKHILSYVVKENPTNLKVPPSPYFINYVFDATKKCGYQKEVIDCIERWWGKFLNKGYTTTPEVWEPIPGSHSLCHAWSAHPIVHFSNILLGIWQEEPGWKKIRFEPSFTHTDSVQGKVATPFGIIESKWERENGKVSVSLQIPKGIRTEIILSGVKRRIITGNFKKQIRIE